VIFDHLEWILFAWVLGNQSGLPIPVVPALLGAGALAGSARLSLSRIIVVAVGASLSADLTWYGLGRWRGERMLRMLARLSPTAMPLVHRARHVFVTHVGAFQLGARFLPELNAISAGLAGTAKVSIVRFAFYGLASAVTWAGGWIGLGYLVSDAVTATAARLGVRLIALLLAPFALYLLFHRARRHRVIQLFRRGRISPDELSAVLEKSDRAHGRRIRDGSDDAQPAATVGTGEGIEIERTAHQRRPRLGVRGDGGALVADDLRSGPT